MSYVLNSSGDHVLDSASNLLLDSVPVVVITPPPPPPPPPFVPPPFVPPPVFVAPSVAVNSRTISFLQLCEEADPDYWEEMLRPVQFEFSNGRKFRRPTNPYGTPATPSPAEPSFMTLVDTTGGDVVDPNSGSIVSP